MSITQQQQQQPILRSESVHFAGASKIVIKTGKVFLFMDPSEIIRIESNGHMSYFHTTGGRYESRSPLSRVERSLQPPMFFRISRFDIVNMDRVKRVEPWFRGQYRFVLKDGTILIATRGYRDRVRRVLENGIDSNR